MGEGGLDFQQVQELCREALLNLDLILASIVVGGYDTEIGIPT